MPVQGTIASSTGAFMLELLEVLWMGSRARHASCASFHFLEGVPCLPSVCSEVQPSGANKESDQFRSPGGGEVLGKSCRGQSKLRPSCRLRNLWVASAISSVLPALVLLSAAQKSLLKPRVLELHPLSPRLLPWLIPDRKQTEKLMKDSGATGTLPQSAVTRTRPAGKDDDVSVTRGSLWRRITGQE